MKKLTDVLDAKFISQINSYRERSVGKQSMGVAETRSASASILNNKELLSNVEYFNRKLKLLKPEQPVDFATVIPRMLASERLSPQEHSAIYRKHAEAIPELQAVLEILDPDNPEHEGLRSVVWQGITGGQFVFGDAPNYGFAREQFTCDIHMPYPVCSFVLPKLRKGCTLLLIVETLRDNQILLTGFVKRAINQIWYPLGHRVRVHQTPKGIKTMAVSGETTALSLELYNRATNALLGFLHAEANKTSVRVKARDIPPEAREFKLYDSHHVIYMKGVIAKRNPSLGGTHARPREHDREAHWRTLASGKKIRIGKTTVNKGVKAKVTKTYRIGNK